MMAWQVQTQSDAIYGFLSLNLGLKLVIAITKQDIKTLRTIHQTPCVGD